MPLRLRWRTKDTNKNVEEEMNVDEMQKIMEGEEEDKKVGEEKMRWGKRKLRRKRRVQIRMRRWRKRKRMRKLRRRTG